MPDIQVNMLAVIIAVIANFILGFIWYTPLFGRTWAVEMGFDPDEKVSGAAITKGMVFMVIGSFLLAWVLAHNIAAWNHVPGVEEISNSFNGFQAALFTWLGFFLPVDLGSVAWEKRSWKLFGINTSYHFISLLIVAMIIVYM
ncbi:MAG: DUF1761 domain-containing protein [Fidelibacterota bacterium]